jgi:hypothetical protein
MGLLSKIFGGGSKKSEVATETPTVECPHAVLVPRWDSVQDMGIEDKATRYMCESCKSFFSPEEARRLSASLAERVAVPPEVGGGDEGGASA